MESSSDPSALAFLGASIGFLPHDGRKQHTKKAINDKSI
jgi:hypothetical protein